MSIVESPFFEINYDIIIQFWDFHIYMVILNLNNFYLL